MAPLDFIDRAIAAAKADGHLRPFAGGDIVDQLRNAGELTRADPWQVTVSEVAYRWGFTHLGRFAGAYRERFGETPSQTLRSTR